MQDANQGEQAPRGLEIGFHLAVQPIGDLLAWVESLELDSAASARGSRLLDDIRNRLRYLVEVGLEYLSLSTNYYHHYIRKQ